MHSSKFLDFKFPSSSIFPFYSYVISQLLLTQWSKNNSLSSLSFCDITLSVPPAFLLVSPSLLCWFFLFLLLDCWVSPCPTSLDEIGRVQGGMAVDCPTSLATPSPCVILPVVFQSLGHVLLFATPWTAACQASLSCTIYQSLLKLMFIESLVPSNHLILCCPLLLLSLSQHQVLFQ